MEGRTVLLRMDRRMVLRTDGRTVLRMDGRTNGSKTGSHYLANRMLNGWVDGRIQDQKVIRRIRAPFYFQVK